MRLLAAVVLLGFGLACGSGPAPTPVTTPVTTPVSEPPASAPEPAAPADDIEDEAPDTPAAAVPNHCAPDEQVVFSCVIDAPGSKVASLCGSPTLTGPDAWLSYRYGRPGEVELAYPVARVPPPEVFTYESHLPSPRRATSWVSFTNAGTRYTVQTVFDDGEEYDVVKTVDAVGRETTRHCVEPVAGTWGALRDALPDQTVVEGHRLAEAARKVMEGDPTCGGGERERYLQEVDDVAGATSALDLDQPLSEVVARLKDVVREGCSAIE